ncbi:TetR/AcrR family transcriptional regulator [Dactylosporangium sp. CA-233914]|uniref:TetR/AcrR family transcriptional regulator n=1 Tax=Dactylosporangium sp. CA-233914 TaxID=3239934 RepID=UPI003D8A05B6
MTELRAEPGELTRKRRSDALDNRERIVAGARAAFTADGTGVPTREVARRAGVGVATVYRHFPSRADLVDAVLAERVAECEATMAAALAEVDPWVGLSVIVRGFAAWQAGDRGLNAVLLQGFPAQRDAHSRQLAALVERGRQAGVVRAGVTVEDVRAGLMGIAGLRGLPPERAGRAIGRLTEVVLAGISAR